MRNQNNTRPVRARDVAGNIAGYALAWAALYALGLAVIAVVAAVVVLVIETGAQAPLLYVAAAVLATVKLAQININRKADR